MTTVPTGADIEDAHYVDIDPDKCCVGRALCNDSLPGWMIPCNAEPTEECVLPNGLILPFCERHNDIWKEVLQTAAEAAAREQQRQDMHTLS